MTEHSNIAVETTLDTSTINASVTTLDVALATGYPEVPFNIHINYDDYSKAEIIRVGAKSGVTFSSLERGYGDSTARSHASGDLIRHVIIDEDIETHTVSATAPANPNVGDVWVNPDVSDSALTVFEDTWIHHLLERPSTESIHANDQEFIGTISGTAVSDSGTTVWTQDKGLLSVTVEDQTAGDYSTRLWTLTPTVPPVTVETVVRVVGESGLTPSIGVCLTDGTSVSSNIVDVAYASSDKSADVYKGTITAAAASTDQTLTYWMMPFIYIRIIWSATNTFKGVWSTDGISWSSFGAANTTQTMTPTHFGVAVAGMDGATAEMVGTFEYLRVTESDLS